MTEPQNRNSNKIIRGLGLLLFLVVLPGGSWYYLQKGLDYQKELRSELTEYGEVPSFQLADTAGKLRDSSIFSGKVAVVGFVTPDESEQAKQMEVLAKLYDQFDKKDQSRIVVYGLNWPQDKNDSFRALRKKYKMENPEKCFFLTGENSNIQNILNQGFKWPSKNTEKDEKLFSLSEKPKNGNYPYLVLVNKDREIINYYDSRDEDRVKTMVEHVAISIPLEKRKKPKLKREQEK